MRNRRQRRIGGQMLDTSRQRVVESGLLLAQPQLFVAVASIAEAPRDLDEALDDVRASELAQLVAAQDLGNLVAESLGLKAVGAHPTLDFVVQEFLEQTDLDIAMLGPASDRVEE